MGRKLLVNNMTVNGAGPRTFFLVEIIVLVFTTSPPAQRREHAWVVWLLVTWHRTTCVFLCGLPFHRHIPPHLPLAGGVVVWPGACEPGSSGDDDAAGLKNDVSVELTYHASHGSRTQTVRILIVKHREGKQKTTNVKGVCLLARNY